MRVRVSLQRDLQLHHLNLIIVNDETSTVMDTDPQNKTTENIKTYIYCDFLFLFFEVYF